MKNLIIKNKSVLTFLVFMGLYILVSSSEADNSEAPMVKKEKEALYSAIQGFVGKWWNGSDLYPDPCGWTPIQGVSCDLYNGLWYVTAINFGPVLDNSLECTQNAKFGHHLFELSHLKTLSFYNCFNSPLQSPVKIPISNWYKLSNSLESLEFRSNTGLIGTIPTTFTSLKNLQSLVLLENGLTGNLPMNLGNLVNLRRLILSRNQFVGQIPPSLGGLADLLIFDSSKNFLSGSLPWTIGGLTSLLKLDLSNNHLEGILPIEIGNMKNLTLLDLSNNNFSGGLTQSLREMVSLQEMVLSNNPIGGDLMRIQWENLKNLESLDLSNMGLKGEVPESLTELKRLRFLGLNNNSLSGTVLARFESMACISALYIDGNNFTGKLEFSELFFSKMGNRFRASNNPNLCYTLGVMSSRNVPKGVKPCQEGNVIPERETIEKMSDGKWNQNSQFVASLGFSSCGVDGFWWGFMAKEVVIVLLCIVLL